MCALHDADRAGRDDDDEKKKKAPKLVCASPPATRKACAIATHLRTTAVGLKGRRTTRFSQQTLRGAASCGQMRPSATDLEGYSIGSGRQPVLSASSRQSTDPDSAVSYLRIVMLLCGDSVQGQFSSTLTSYAGGPSDYETVTILNSKRKPLASTLGGTCRRRE